MPMNKSEVSMISNAVETLFSGVESLHAATVYGIKRAYSAGDKGEFLQALADQIPTAYVAPFSDFIKRAGIYCVTDKKQAVIGGPTDPKKQREAIAWASSNIGALLALVEAHIPARKPREVKAKSGTWAEQADKAIKDFVARQKKANPDVGAIINQAFQRPAWYAKFAALELTEAEVEAIVTAIQAERMAGDDDEVVFHVKVA